MSSPQANLAAAHAAFSRGDLGAAKQLLAPLVEGSAPQLDALHLLAVVERRIGNFSIAQAHFERVLQSCPNDPHLHNNFANCLREAQSLDAAVEHYQCALALQPEYLDARLNLGLTMKALGRFDEAHAEFERAVQQAPDSMKAWQCLGNMQRELGELSAAAISFDEAIKLDPNNVQVRYARALLEAEQGKPSIALYAQAHTLAPHEPEIVLGHALATYESGASDDALAMLERLVVDRPDWVKGHAALAQMRWQLGESTSFARSFDEALTARPSDLELQVGCFGTLMRAGQYSAVLERLPRARSAIDADALFDRYEAVCASETGDIERAERAFIRQSDSPDVGLQIARLRHLLRSQRPAEAACLAEAMVQSPAANDAWPYLSLAWRLTQDPRAKWLDREDLVAHFECFELQPNLARIAELLRRVHHGRIHPFDQSLRGGTQTDGHLFRRNEPELVELRNSIEAGIVRYIEQLPPFDANHPFLRHRHSRFEFIGSYSVRLRANGYHVNHMHPDAWISCCLYVDMPSSIGGDSQDPAGWLTVGLPPSELGIDLPALTRVRPEPGRLAVFPSFMWHGTTPFPSGERLTVVSDLQAVS